ncbi:MAG: cysteine desulfurase family protein [Leptonema sp. (in: bacteria)]
MIYFDYNSTHPPIESILQENLKSYLNNWANPSGISFFSQRNFAKIEQSRKKILELLKKFYSFYSNDATLIFNSTGTEAVYQMVFSFFDKDKPYAFVSPYEHECFYSACSHFGLHAFMLPANPKGMVNPQDVFSLIEQEKIPVDKISFIACIFVSNETGVIQPIKELSEVAKKLNLPLISDTIQIAGKIPYDFSFLDGFTMNGHKIGAGFGTSVFVSKNSKRIKSIFKGGLQENEFRAGTENVFSILNFAEAMEWQMNHQEMYKKNIEFQRKIENFLKKECNAILVGENSPRVFHTTYAIFPEISNLDFLLISLDQHEIVCSTGSSCKSRTRQPSEILMRMGFSKEMSLQALRFSTGVFTNESEVNSFCEIFRKIYKNLL